MGFHIVIPPEIAGISTRNTEGDRIYETRSRKKKIVLSKRKIFSDSVTLLHTQ
jgi:hypothetical protein